MYKEYKNKLAPTSSDIEGPFYKKDAPFRTDLVENPTLVVSGIVKDTEGNPVNALLDFWQADPQGVYDNDGFNLRGRQETQNGQYHLNTVHPGDYQIDEHEFRCAHIHVKITAEGYKPLTTQLYFDNDPYNATDQWFDAKRIIRNNTFNFILEKE